MANTNLFRFALVVILLCCFIPEVIAQQMTVSGTIRDSIEGTPLDGAYVVVTRSDGQSILSYEQTESSGAYQLEVSGAGTYFIKVSYVGYATSRRQIIYDGSANRTVSINFAMGTGDGSGTLSEVTVRAERPPMIVHGDTAVFDPSHWAEMTDDNLEDALRKMPGFEVSADGSLKFNGRKIQQVLIDGEIVTDVGAALLTRGISTDQVASLEVRMKDRSSKLRNDLLDSESVMVLDIKLNEESKQQTFGRMRVGGGSGEYTAPDAYTSAFRLGGKVKIHLLGEYEAFGKPTISLSDIKNIGREAYAAIFDIPADFSRLQDNPEFNRELYGFDHFSEARDAVVALSANVKLDSLNRIYVGSYNNATESTLEQSLLLQPLNTGESFRSDQVLSGRQLTSKNKIEFNHSGERSIFRYNVSGVFRENEPLQTARYLEGNQIDFLAREDYREVSQNLAYSHKFTKDQGLSVNLYHSVVDQEVSRDFTATEPVTIGLPDSVVQLTTAQQTEDRRENTSVATLKWQQPILKFPVTFGFQYLRSMVDGRRSADTPTQGLFAAPSRRLLSATYYPFVEFDVAFPVLSLSMKGGLAQQVNPLLELGSVQRKQFLQYDVRLSKSGDQLTVQANTKRQVGAFPLANYLRGAAFTSFNILRVPVAVDLLPQLEETTSLFLSSYVLEEFGIGFDLGLIAGRSFNSLTVLPPTGPVIVQQPDQNESRYVVLVGKVVKALSSMPVAFKFEQNYIRNVRFNPLPNMEEAGNFKTFFTAVQSKLGVRTTPELEKWSAGVKYGINRYSFSSDLSAANSVQIFQNLEMNAGLKTFKKKLYTGFDLRVARISRAEQDPSRQVILGANMRYKLGMGLLTLNANNLFNATDFEQRDILPTVLNIQQNRLFGRYVKASYRFDF